MVVKETVGKIFAFVLTIALFVAMCLCPSGIAFAEETGGVSLPNYYSSGLVFQYNQPFVVQGRAPVRTKLRVTIGNHTAQTVTSDKGSFKVGVKPLPPSLKPYGLSIFSGNTQVFSIDKVYSGDVIVAYGQSNMELTKSDIIAKGAKAKDLPMPKPDANIHFLAADRVGANAPSSDLPLKTSTWLDAGSSADKLSYLALQTASNLRKKNPKRPVGVLNVAWAGAPLSRMLGDGWNTHMAPLKGFHVGGVIYYQGESDAMADLTPWQRFNFYLYGSLDGGTKKGFSSLIDKTRKLFGQKNLPFVFAQIARYDDSTFYFPPVRDAQWKSMSLVKSKKNLAMVSTLDTDKGSSDLLHPLGKDIIGQRMADQLNAMWNGKSVPTGPIPDKATAKSGTITVSFRNGTGKGLKTMAPLYSTRATAKKYAVSKAGNEVKEVEVAGADGVFKSVKAVIQGDRLVVRTSVAKPTQVRYAYSASPRCPNLYNGQNLPAGTFVIDVKGATPVSKPSTIVFNNNQGGGTIEPLTGASGAAAVISKKVPIKPGFAFKEWNTMADGTGTSYAAGQQIVLPKEDKTTLFAVWEAGGDTNRIVDTDGTGMDSSSSTGKDDGTSNETGTTFNSNVTVLKDDTYRLSMEITPEKNMENPVVNDVLSQWIEPIALQEGKTDGIDVYRDGGPLQMGMDYDAAYDQKNRKVTVSFRTAMEIGHRYQVKFNIKPSNKAYAHYSKNHEYPDEGADNSGESSAGKKGYKVCDKGGISWSAGSGEFSQSVIQVSEKNIHSAQTSSSPKGDDTKNSAVPWWGIVSVGVGLIVVMAAVVLHAIYGGRSAKRNS